MAIAGCTAIAFACITFAALPGDTGQHLLGAGPYSALAVRGAAGLVMLLPAALLRRMPLPVFAALLGCSAAVAIVLREKGIPLPLFLAVDVAAGFIAAHRPRRMSIPTAAVALGVLACYAATRAGPRGALTGLSAEWPVALTVVIAWLIGNSVRQRRDYAEALRERPRPERSWPNGSGSPASCTT